MRLLTIILSLLCLSAFAEVTPGEFAKTKELAEKGEAISQFNLGRIYYNGDGVSKDLVEAAKWWRKAAELGNAMAQYNLGCCYDSGEGVLKDSVEAYAYYNLAGITLQVARKNRDILAKEMTPEQLNAGQKRSKELQAEIEARITLKK
jgi:hypothetical protein